MDLKRLDDRCPRCHAIIDVDSDSCPACQSVLPTKVPSWPTIQAHDGGVVSPLNCSVLGNTANPKSPAHIPTNPTPEALQKTHQLNLTTQPPPTMTGSNRIRAVGERLYKFIHHSGPPAVDTVRATRACLSCYNSVKCTPGPNPDCCGPCKGKNRYCRGPIHAPVLIDIQSWFRTAFARLQSQCSSLETIVKERSIYSLSIKVDSTGAIESYDVDLQSADSHAPTPYDASSIARVLDVVFPADQKASLNTRSLAAQHNPGDNLESVVRRFVACSMLLCAPALSRIDGSQFGHAAAPYVVLEFNRRIGQEACNLFQCICHEADEFANSKPRNKVTFVADKRLFAFNLGLVHSSVQSLVSAKSNATGSHFMPENVYDIVPAVLEKLEWLAMGFNKTAFVDGRRCLHSELTELHIGFSSLKGKTSISGSSNQASSLRDNLVPNVSRMNSPIAQDSVAQSPGQLSGSSLIQRSGENMVENCPESPWLARELDRFYQNDLYDVLRSPVQERSLQEDAIRQAKAELKHHDSAINKHLVKKAALEEKSKSWELDSTVSSNIVDGDSGAVDPFQTEPAIEKRIRELEEASKRQDLAIQKHNTKKAALERGIKRSLDYEPDQPSKRPVFEAAEGHTSEPSPLENPPRDDLWDEQWDDFGDEADSLRSRASIASFSGWNYESEPPGSQRRGGDNWYGDIYCGNRIIGNRVQGHQPQNSVSVSIEQQVPRSGGEKRVSVTQRIWASSLGSVMDEMFKKFERVAIGAWPARKSRDKSAVPVDDSVKK
ncbi:hypothetical protein JMJ35_007847 [Cladonia borealis]|uniref:Uncharacterized protein n=1 Tax=Cladonia borealis TaxID=184061 RepID=A0AA39QXB9_9LECA|nr:hypothetical protein JMJ35_007847 [Cladonia borealis]